LIILYITILTNGSARRGDKLVCAPWRQSSNLTGQYSAGRTNGPANRGEYILKIFIT